MNAMEARPPTLREWEQAKRDWLEAIQPLVKQKASIVGMGGFRVAVNPDGSLGDLEPVMTDEQRQLLAQIDELIEIAKPAILNRPPQQ